MIAELACYIFLGIMGILFIIACTIGVVALYFNLKNWAYDEMDIELPPKAKVKSQESYWEFSEDSVTPTYVCRKCRFKSDKKYWYCPCCGKSMENHNG